MKAVFMFAGSIWSSYSIFDWLDILGPILVLIGVCQELRWHLKKYPEDHPNLENLELEKHKKETKAIALVVLGVALELLVVPHTLKEVAELQSKNLELELKIKPRTISDKQIKDFIFLTEKITKIPVRVSIGQEGADTEFLAFQLDSALSQAGFGKSADSQEFGIFRDPTRLYVTRPGRKSYGADIILVVPSDEIFERFMAKVSYGEATNGLTRPIPKNASEEEVYFALFTALKQSGLNVYFWASQWKEPRNFELYVPIKNQF